MLDAGAASRFNQHMEAPAAKPARAAIRELYAYYLMVGLYFFAFGMQFVLFPYLAAFLLKATATGVGLAQSALSAPMFCLLLFGGLVAERARAGMALARLHLLFCIASLALAWLVGTNALNYELLIAYATFVGICAAFLMPVRDAALNGVVARETALGRNASIATAAATTTAVQIGAQIAGILVARFAGHAPAPFLVLQAGVLALGAMVALTLRAPKPTGHERSISGALKDVRDGLAYSFRSPVMAPMLVSAAYVGVFVVGALQVLFPLIIRDEYGGSAQAQAGRLGTLLACFWAASFVSAATLSWRKPLLRPGRAMILSHLVSAAALATLAVEKPFFAFIGIALGWGLAAGIAISMSRTIVQGAAEPRFLGRVLSVYSMGFMGGAPIGSAIIGFATEQMGPHAAALIPAGGLGLAALGLALFTPLWARRADTAAD